MLQIGQTIQKRYQIMQLLGQGGMGIVYLAQDNRLGDGHQVAIKELSPAGIPSAEWATALALFEQEATILAGLNHPGVTRVSDFFNEGGYWYLVMEYVAGESLAKALERAPAGYSEQQCLIWAEQLLRVLDYLHQRTPPLIFRDLKPQNIMVKNDGSLKLIDFGIARFFKSNQQLDTVQLGTPGYAAPEQYGRQQTDARSDIYSLGVVLYQLLTGYDPTNTPLRMPPLQQLQSAVSNRTALAIHKAMAVEPGQRHQTAGDFAAALGVPISGPLPPPPPPPIPAWPLIAKIAAIVLFVTLCGWLLFPPIMAQFRTATPTTHITYIVITNTPTATTNSPTPTQPPPPTSTYIPTSTPRPTATFIPATPTRIPTMTRLPASPTPAPTVCSRVVNSLFTNKWQANLGCPTTNLLDINMAQETFVNGRMFWRQDNDRIYAVYSNGSWVSYPDIWVEGHPAFSCGTPQSPPTPQRGFGKIWCAHSNVQQGLGNATDMEWATYGEIQEFVNGMIWRVGGGTTIVFYYNNTWR